MDAWIFFNNPGYSKDDVYVQLLEMLDSTSQLSDWDFPFMIDDPVKVGDVGVVRVKQHGILYIVALVEVTLPPAKRENKIGPHNRQSRLPATALRVGLSVTDNLADNPVPVSIAVKRGMTTPALSQFQNTGCTAPLPEEQFRLARSLAEEYRARRRPRPKLQHG